MFHTPNEVNIKITWQNKSRTGLLVSWIAEEGEEGSTPVGADETSPQFNITLPESRLRITIGPVEPPINSNLPTLPLEWVVDADGNGHFQLQTESYPWEPTSARRNEDKFSIHIIGHVTFSHILSSEGVVIVGILDIGGGGHHQ